MELTKKLMICLSVFIFMYIVVWLLVCLERKIRVKSNKTFEKNPMEGKRVIFVEDLSEKENADGMRGHLEECGELVLETSIYEKTIKRFLDSLLSFLGLLILAPCFLLIIIAIEIDDPGPVFFSQKRIGKNKTYFKLYKFRSMKMETPHDTPTHMLNNPEQYVTHVGAFLRKHSLDELPQLYNVLVGDLSLVGPRPGLWNQDVLTAERDKYGVNQIKPGITGWAQINGRDTISIQEKARLDGYYKNHISLWLDLKCLVKTVVKVGYDDTVVEGGEKEMKINTIESQIPMAILHEDCDDSKSLNILVAGQGSYIGNSFVDFLKNYNQYIVETFDTFDNDWMNRDFSKYDVVYCVAGIAHVKENNKNRKLYYDVNRDLAFKIAQKAKEDGVSLFIYLSSMSVYGMEEGEIDKMTPLSPRNAYAKSKTEAEMLLWDLVDDRFKVAILRPPMVYGKNCKGNYQFLRKFSLKSKLFPRIKNLRSMIFVDNLSSVVRWIMHNNESGVYFPQNRDYFSTVDMVKEIANINGKNVFVFGGFGFVIKCLKRFSSVFRKVFGTLIYREELNVPDKWLEEKNNYITLLKCEHGNRQYVCHEKKNILVLMSSHNGEKYIAEQIESIMKQKTKHDVYLKIRDDGSTDKTCQIIEEMQALYPNKIKLIKGENIGYNASFFELLNDSKGFDYYSISDQDDIWLDEKLDIAVAMLDNEYDGRPQLYASTSFLVENNLIPYGTTRKRERALSIYNTVIQNICPGHTQVMNEELLNLIQGNIDCSRVYVYDSWITNMAMLYGKIIFDNDSHTFYRQHRGNQMGSGVGSLGQLIASGKRVRNNDGHQYRRQIEYFVEMNEKELSTQGFLGEIRRFLNAKTLGEKISYAISGKLYRQKKLETIAFYLMDILGKY